MANWPSDKELEEIYRKGSENHNFEYDPSAWDDMTILLDKKDRRRKIFFILLGVLLLISSGIAYNFVSQSESIINTKSEASRIEYNMDTEEEAFSNLNQIKGTVTLDDKVKLDTNTEGNTNSTKAESAINFENSVNKDGFRNKAQERQQHDSRSSLKAKSDLLNSLNEAVSQTEEQKSTIDLLNTAQSRTSDNAAVQLGNLDYNQPASQKFTNINTLPYSDFLLFETAPFLRLPKPEVVQFNNDSEKNNTSAIELFTQFGAESSWTPTGEFSSIDYSLGLGFNLRLGNKLGFTIGSSYIRDLYIANQGDYRPNHEFWIQSEEPSFTSANCKMIELNTGLSYYFNGWKNDGIGIQIGLLSNFMLSEKYDYHFEIENMNFSSSWTGSNKTWLNAIDISPTYRFTYGNNGNIELSPYFKIPLNGIGHGDVLLSSFGLRGRFRIL